MTTWDAARAIITRQCNEIGFPPPADEDTTIVDWADTSVDHSLAPRGSEHWRHGRTLLTSALDAALVGDSNAVTLLLMQLRAFVLQHGQRRCECPTKLLMVRHGGDPRPFCSGCHLRPR